MSMNVTSLHQYVKTAVHATTPMVVLYADVLQSGQGLLAKKVFLFIKDVLCLNHIRPNHKKKNNNINNVQIQ